ncbi:hypothetical protein Acy02nite_68560 [Actinoplanes cyaneus]|uniref:Deoxynucleoside monophosphate kinase n=1 Tax=Actinoplanes cyaneus TaxID=52696 RepID=A0A919M442_9ACTN|nr:hypothetical protein [Actinoplanes cyaneus]MCW2139095.1 hypothetical protein [Actinoplanes cyaneus]GID68975.1 hypothetical protein Acy02nite_68560 [Actinoplanes cyaneus]
MTHPIVGLVGRKRTGKDTVAIRLVQRQGFRRLAFADRLRDAALALNPIVVPREPAWATLRLGDIVGSVGWETAKDEYPEVRRTLQELGNGIRALDPDFWLRPVIAEARASWRPIVITDVRYPNEADAVERAGGVLVRITRPGGDKSDDHESETALEDRETQMTIANDRLLEHLFEKVDALAAIVRSV